ncbi:hypothetical protein [Nakamurella multipartita]|uniref:Uncharacterized protein n=1 Tax=Nakamurella multipartita (strain ATCC 700099 / DSM 44233 / CIP 104796 / JCM 9543 / NBRC 105858 / Y-104) TaxID=479431 RepID=C8XHE0_NAKMY|nr:hypothetical protein [Nakamurella multipartita]ACV78346.1 hypothetical protein Namu_1957 [Nakamurella multipartita DSM 44233]
MSAAAVNGVDHERDRHFTANVVTTLREDYRLRTDEAERAVGLFLRRKTGWSTPDQAAFEAYRWWTPTVEPSIVLTREAEQRVHARRADATSGSDPRADREVGDDVDLPRVDAVRADLAATESALAMIRDEGRRNGFTTDQVELARQLRLVLDESPVWDSITANDPAMANQPEPAVLEPALQPETVRPGNDWDDIIAVDAAFAGRTITVLRPPGQIGPFSYVFLADTPGNHYTEQAADTSTLGMIAAGDGEPDPARAAEYDDLGQQVRRHLIGLVDAVAEARELRQQQEGRRLHAAQTSLGSVAEGAYQRPRPAHGTSR